MRSGLPCYGQQNITVSPHAIVIVGHPGGLVKHLISLAGVSLRWRLCRGMLRLVPLARKIAVPRHYTGAERASPIFLITSSLGISGASPCESENSWRSSL
jgi:hypothetical protein